MGLGVDYKDIPQGSFSGDIIALSGGGKFIT